MAYIVGAVLLVLIALVGSCSSVTVVDTGHRGIKTVFGKVQGEPLPEGIYFASPFSTNIVEMDIKTQRFDAESQIYTKDVQQAVVKYAVNYSLDGSQIGHLYSSVGTDFAAKLIPPAVEGSIKSTFGKWEAVDVIANREKMRSAVEESLKSNLAQRGILVERFELMNVDYSDEFEKAVEAKVTAIQLAEQAKNQTVRIREEADQKIISAKAEAESMKIRSEALSQNKSLVDYEAVQKWDGKLPTYMMGNSVPFMNLGAK